MTNESVPPRVFISYSHDSAEHKHWVLRFATTLRQRGVDAVLDQRDMQPGADLAHFMESELATCDFTLMICTEEYVEKANAGSGGVGFEKMIVTANFLKKIDNKTVIPVIRQKGARSVPTFLQTKVFVDFSNDKDVEYAFDELLRTLLNEPLFEKPEIGKSSFVPMAASTPDRATDGIKAAMSAIAAALNSNTGESTRLDMINIYTQMHKLSLLYYLDASVAEGLLDRSPSGYYSVSSSGFQYLIDHGVIDV